MQLQFLSKKNKSTSAIGDIYSSQEFQIMLERERARVERNGAEFTLIIFDVNPNVAPSRAIHAIDMIKKRARITDVVGWLDSKRVGVFLPDTPEEGGWIFAQDVNTELVCSAISLPVHVFCYPPKIKDNVPNSFAMPGFPKNGSAKTCVKIVYNSEKQDINTIFAKPTPFSKRLVDFFGAALGLVLLTPVLIFTAIVIKLVSPGPVFFRQKRIGYKAKEFTLFKFRTMKVNSDSHVHEKHLQNLIASGKPMTKLDCKKDERIIPFGRFFRNTGIDELPQLINVLKGEMSLIGPRPSMPYEAREFQLWHKKRFDVLPGITGAWQVNGKNKTTFKEMMRLDVLYTQKQNFGQDIKILLKTLPAIYDQIKDILLKRKEEPCISE